VSRRHRKRRARELTGLPQVSPGLAPGTLIAPPGALPPETEVICYRADEVHRQRVGDLSELQPLLARWPLVWVHVAGLGDANHIARLGEIFRLHRLALEDVMDVRQRTKVEEYPDHLFCTTRMTGLLGDELTTEQLGLFLGDRFVVTIIENPGDCFDAVRERILRGRGRIRSAGPDYLAYALLDATIDSFFPVLEHLGERVEDLEALVVERPDTRLLSRVYGLKRDLISLRRSIWPLREAINGLLRDESPRFLPDTRLYLRDCYDHVIQILDMIETFRDVTSTLIETYLSSAGTRLNEVMKVLTIISTIFIPLSFIASVYGMNFDRASPWNMPELGWTLGYPFVLAVMACTALSLLYFFHRKGWLAALSPSEEAREARRKKAGDSDRGVEAPGSPPAA
jgi:magnesium transporter